MIQQGVEFVYKGFITRVAKARKQDVAAIDAVAQGRVWSGADAKRLGLVDQLGGYQDAIDLAAQLANLGKDFHVEYVDDRQGFSEAMGHKFRVMLAGMVAPLLPQGLVPDLPAAVKPVVAEFDRLNRLRDPRNVYMYCLACTLD
jgi:protease-4